MKRDLPAYCYRKGRAGYIYYSRRGQKLVRMHSEPGTPEFAAEYALLLRGRQAKPVHTIRDLIVSYQASHKWKRLAANTRKSYQRSFDYFMETMSDADPTRLKRVHVIEMRDTLADTPTTANRRVAALSVLFEHAIDLGWMPKDFNPAKGVEQLEPPRDPREPWPLEMVEAFRAAAPPLPLLIFELLIGTGQRIGDVLKMRWDDVKEGGLPVRQTKDKTKRKRPIWVPFTPRLLRLLAETPRRGETIVAQENGKPASYQLAWSELMKVRRMIGAEKWDPHALRHSAASEIASLPGMTFDHVRAITGHSSDDMARLYAGIAAQKARAKEAQERRD